MSDLDRTIRADETAHRDTSNIERLTQALNDEAQTIHELLDVHERRISLSLVPDDDDRAAMVEPALARVSRQSNLADRLEQAHESLCRASRRLRLLTERVDL